jgi:hypothetical protein
MVIVSVGGQLMMNEIEGAKGKDAGVEGQTGEGIEVAIR